MRARWLGRVTYAEALDLQRAIAASPDDVLLLLEHPPTYTLGTHGDLAHVLVDPALVGAELQRVDRGGDVTFHGPGQLVGYPIHSVGAGPHRGPAHVADVEAMVLDALVLLGVPSTRIGRLTGFPGIWFDPDGGPAGQMPRKVAAVGVRVARGRTTHGFGLNVTTDLSMFDHIVPCGMPDRPMTSLAAEGIDVTMADVVDAVIAAASRQFGPIDDVAKVTDGAASGGRSALRPGLPSGAAPVELRSLDRRLARAGVDVTAGLDVAARKPEWLRVPATMGRDYVDLKRDLAADGLVTVCEEAGSPNIYECWSDGTATFMINGSRCTRACGFCLVDTRLPLALDPGEPEAVAEAVTRMGLAHAVITCVARDDLPDGGAGAFAATIAAIRRTSPTTQVEVLISDLKGDARSLEVVLEAGPDVLNHNIETVARLQRAVRPSAGYARSLTVLGRSAGAGMTVKSGLIVGMGESLPEVLATLEDLASVGVDIVTIGQYLRPTSRHLPVARWWTPAEFEEVRVAGQAMGFAHVQASPLTRSSYHARESAASAQPVPVTLAQRP